MYTLYIFIHICTNHHMLDLYQLQAFDLSHPNTQEMTATQWHSDVQEITPTYRKITSTGKKRVKKRKEKNRKEKKRKKRKGTKIKEKKRKETEIKATERKGKKEKQERKGDRNKHTKNIICYWLLLWCFLRTVQYRVQMQNGEIEV